MRVLPRKFYQRDPAKVAELLLGKVLVRRFRGSLKKGLVVETEAYYGTEDPASRLRLGSPKYCEELMCGEVGKAFIYNVHNNWLLNIVAHPRKECGAVLIRALQPLWKVKNSSKTLPTNGPGKLCKALRITKALNGVDVCSSNSPLFLCEEDVLKQACGRFKVARSFRIGVSRDLNVPLRFFVKGNEFVSR